MILRNLLLFSLPLLLRASQLGSEPIISYIDGNSQENECKTKLERRIFGYSGTIFSHSEYGYNAYNATKNCIIILAVPAGYKLRLRVVDFDVPTDLDGKCSSGDTLHIFDHENAVEESVIRRGGDDLISPGAILGQFCGRLNQSQVLAVSNQNALTLWWHSAPRNDLHSYGSSSNGGRGFRLYWNAFRQAKNIPCNIGREFACSKVDECIPSELACNKQSDCKDGSDINIRRQIDYKCENVDLDPLATVSGVHLLLLSLVTVLCVVMLCACGCLMCRCMHRSQPVPVKTPVKHCLEAQGLRTLPDGCTPFPPSFHPPSPPKLRETPPGFVQTTRQNPYLPGFPKSADLRGYGFVDQPHHSSGEYAFVKDTRHII